MKVIPISAGRQVLVDDEDFERMSQHRWTFSGKYAYRQVQAGGRKHRRSIYMHREIFPDKEAFQVDHKNRNTLDNRKENLRACTQQQNSLNRDKSSNNPSGYKGVFPNPAHPSRSPKPWRSQIAVNGKTIHLGVFHTKEGAALAYNQASELYHGDFGFMNNLPASVKSESRTLPAGAFRIKRGKRERWESKIRVHGKMLYLGNFKTPEEATAAYNAAVLKHRSPFHPLRRSLSNPVPG